MPLEDEDHAADTWVDPSQGGVLGRVLEAAETGDEDVLAVALPALSVSVDTTGPDGDTALHLALRNQRWNAKRALVADVGADAMIVNSEGETPCFE